MIKFICASHDDAILSANLLKSPIFYDHPGSLDVLSGYANIPMAYNSFPPVSKFAMYVHHDVYLPVKFELQLAAALADMEKKDPNWGVLGVAGVRYVYGLKENIGHIKDRGREWGEPSTSGPRLVDTLDELLLITKGDFRFDEQFDLHFYGADICMQAKLQGRKCYAIDAYCHHNSGLPLGYRSQSFRDCEAKFRAKYINHLPIATTCTILQ